MTQKTKTIIAIILFIIFIVVIAVSYQLLKNEEEEKKLSQLEQRKNQVENISTEQIGNQTTSSSQKNQQKYIDFTVENELGEMVSLSQYIGKPIVINYWATWCAYCIEEMPYFNKMFEKEKENITFFMINATDGVRETKEKAKNYVQKSNYQFPIFYDTNYSARNNYYIDGYPTTIFIDKEGNLFDIYYGAISEKTLTKYMNLLK